MRTTMGGILAIVMLMLAPSRGAAQPQVYCPPGLFKGCVAVEVRDGASGTEIRLQNLQGSMDADDFARTLIQDVWVELLPTDVWWHASNFDWRGTVDNNVPRVHLDGPAYRGGGPDLEHGRIGSLPTDGLRAAIVDPILHYYSSMGGAFLEGCENPLSLPPVPTPRSASFYAATCPSQGYSGWVVLSMPYGLYDRTSHEFVRWTQASDIRIRWDAFGWSSVRGEGPAVKTGCTIGVDCDVYSYSVVSVAPEPGTWAMLGTGLLALGGVAARRRRGGR